MFVKVFCKKNCKSDFFFVYQQNNTVFNNDFNKGHVYEHFSPKTVIYRLYGFYNHINHSVFSARNDKIRCFGDRRRTFGDMLVYASFAKARTSIQARINVFLALFNGGFTCLCYIALIL